jgi:hypothetical protein
MAMSPPRTGQPAGLCIIQAKRYSKIVGLEAVHALAGVMEDIALAHEEVTELFGWPVALLEEIRELRGLAERGEIWIDEWRRRDAALRAVGPEESPMTR